MDTALPLFKAAERLLIDQPERAVDLLDIRFSLIVIERFKGADLRTTNDRYEDAVMAIGDPMQTIPQTQLSHYVGLVIQESSIKAVCRIWLRCFFRGLRNSNHQHYLQTHSGVTYKEFKIHLDNQESA